MSLTGQAGAGATRGSTSDTELRPDLEQQDEEKQRNYRNPQRDRPGLVEVRDEAWSRTGAGESRRASWLLRVGPAPIDAWAVPWGGLLGTARSHAARLTREQWLDRVARPRGEGSLFFATRRGVGVAGVDVPPVPVPAPTWWRHLEACAWVAAWLTAREREMLGPRELLVRQAWRGSFSGCRARESSCTVPISSASFRAAVPPPSRSS